MKLKLLQVKPEVQGINTYIFEKPKNFNYLPGQYLVLIFSKSGNLDKESREFTLSSSPTEDHLSITTKNENNSDFKRKLETLQIGDSIEADGPFGTFILDEDISGKHILLAGGIGVTPFRSIIKYNVDKNLKNTDIHLIYSSSNENIVLFKDDFDNWTNDNIDITFVLTSDNHNKMWKGEVGRIDNNMIKRLTTYYLLPTTTFWICGSKDFVRDMESILLRLKVKPDKVHSETFTGY